MDIHRKKDTRGKLDRALRVVLTEGNIVRLMHANVLDGDCVVPCAKKAKKLRD